MIKPAAIGNGCHFLPKGNSNQHVSFNVLVVIKLQPFPDQRDMMSPTTSDGALKSAVVTSGTFCPLE